VQFPLLQLPIEWFDLLFETELNAENNFWFLMESQVGQCTSSNFVVDLCKKSNLVLHSEHLYSKIGI